MSHTTPTDLKIDLRLTYDQFKELITTIDMDKRLYYAYLIHFREPILMDVMLNGQKAVAKDLNIQPTYMSTVVGMLRALQLFPIISSPDNADNTSSPDSPDNTGSINSPDNTGSTTDSTTDSITDRTDAC